jgi:hypothetical protein
MINISQEYKGLSIGGLVLVGLTIITKIIANKQKNSFKNRGRASKFIISILLIEFLAWFFWLIALTYMTSREGAKMCWETYNAFHSQWATLRVVMFVMWLVWGVLFFLGISACCKARRGEAMFGNAGNAEQPSVTVVQNQRVMQPQIMVMQAQPVYAYGAQPQQMQYGYGAPQQYGYQSYEQVPMGEAVTDY